MKDYLYVKNNYEALLYEIERHAERACRPVPKLLPVTKSGSDEELLALFSFGAAAIGENRPGELKRRAELLIAAGYAPELHQIGNLQSNKAKLVCDRVSLIHSLDSLSLAKEIDRQGKKLGRVIPVLIEINSAEEVQKGGILPRDAERFYEAVAEFENIRVSGLMTMGPVSEQSEDIRPYFRLTKKLFDKLEGKYGFGEEPTLSMGMTDSISVAIEEGSTLLRVGRKLFQN